MLNTLSPNDYGTSAANAPMCFNVPCDTFFNLFTQLRLIFSFVVIILSFPAIQTLWREIPGGRQVCEADIHDRQVHWTAVMEMLLTNLLLDASVIYLKSGQFP